MLLVALYGFAFSAPQFVVACSSVPSLPTITFVISGSQFPLPPSAYVLNVSGPSQGLWLDGADSCPYPSSHLGSYGESRGRAGGEQEFRHPKGCQGRQGGGSLGEEGRSLQRQWLYPGVPCPCRTAATAGWASRPLTCPPPRGSRCGSWGTSSSRSTTRSTTWPPTGWALPWPPRRQREAAVRTPHAGPAWLGAPRTVSHYPRPLPFTAVLLPATNKPGNSQRL